jgi:hypothetical protein
MSSPKCLDRPFLNGLRYFSGGEQRAVEYWWKGVSMIFHVSLEEAEDGWIVAEVPALPGCVSQGRDEKEALDNVSGA